MMAEELTQVEADELLAMPKSRVLDMKYQVPLGGSGIMIALRSPDRRETFDLGIWRSQAILFKGSYRLKGRGVVMLARVDFGGAPHRNPDGQEIPVPPCTSIAKATATNTRRACLKTALRIPLISGRCWTTSWISAISLRSPMWKGSYSNGRRSQQPHGSLYAMAA
jgi:hypothetical protein